MAYAAAAVASKMRELEFPRQMFEIAIRRNGGRIIAPSR